MLHKIPQVFNKPWSKSQISKCLHNLIIDFFSIYAVSARLCSPRTALLDRHTIARYIEKKTKVPDDCTEETISCFQSKYP